MAYDALIDSNKYITQMTAIADAIREKTDTAAPIAVVDMPSMIQNISVGGDNQQLIQDIDRTITSIEMPAESIGPYAFAEATALTTVTNTDGIGYYGPYCFYNCTSLSKIGDASNSSISADSVTIGTYAFAGTKLGNLDIKTATVPFIGEYAFADAELGIVSFVNTGDTAFVFTIDSRAFANSSITALNIEGVSGTYASIREFAFDGSTISYADFTKIVHVDAAGFRGTRLQSIQLRSGLYLQAGDLIYSVDMNSCSLHHEVTGVFAHCAWLSTVTAACNIPSYCFYSTTNLTSVELQPGCTELGAHAFEASGIGDITIPITVLHVGEYAFAWSKLRTITCDAVHINENNRILFNAKELETVVVHNESNIKSFDISDQAFENCGKLVNLTFDINPRYVGNRAFRGCESLPDQPWISDAKVLGSYSFADCISFKNITVKPDQQIKCTAFSGCILDTITADERYLVSTFGATVDTYTIICENPDGVISRDDSTDEVNISNDIPSWVDPFVDCASGLLSQYFDVVPVERVLGYPANLMEITHLVLPTYTTIAASTFALAHPLQTVVGDSEIITIGSSAFYGLDKLMSVDLNSKSSISIDTYCFRDSCHDKEDSQFTLNAADTITADAYAFYNGPKSLTLVAGSDISLGNFCCAERRLEECSITTPTTLTIGDNAFQYTQIGALPIPECESVVIGNYAFSYCDKLDPYVEAKDYWQLGDYVFEHTSIEYAFCIPQLTEGLFYQSNLMYVVPSTDCTAIGNDALATYSIKAVYIPGAVSEVHSILVSAEPDPDNTVIDVYDGAGPYIISMPDNVVDISGFFYSQRTVTDLVSSEEIVDGNTTTTITITKTGTVQIGSIATNVHCLRLSKNAGSLDFTDDIKFLYLEAIDFGTEEQMAAIFDRTGADRSYKLLGLPASISSIESMKGQEIHADSVFYKDGVHSIDDKLIINNDVIFADSVTSIASLDISSCSDVRLSPNTYSFTCQLGGNVSEFIIPESVTQLPDELQIYINPSYYRDNNKLHTVYAHCSAETMAQYPRLFSNSWALQDVYVTYSRSDAEAADALLEVPEGCSVHYSSIPYSDRNITVIDYFAYVGDFGRLLRFYKENQDDEDDTAVYIDELDSVIKMYKDTETDIWYLADDDVCIYTGLGDTPDTVCWAPLYEHINYDEDEPIYRMNPLKPPLIIKNKTTPVKKLIDAIRITTVDGGNSVSLNGSQSDMTMSTLQYRVSNTVSNETTDFAEYTLGTSIALENAGDYVEFRNTSNRLSYSTDRYIYFSIENDATVLGPLSALVGGNYYADDYSFYKLFSGCPILNTPYMECFIEEWTGVGAFSYMFEDCTKLTKVSKLISSDVRMNSPGSCSYAYHGLFKGCTALENASGIFGMHPFMSGYQMFEGCSSLTKVDDLTGELIGSERFDARYMFKDCTALETTPIIDAQKGIEAVSMFEGCTALTSTADIYIDSNSWVGNALKDMFKGCTNLSTVYAKWTKWANYVTHKDWLNGASETGTFYRVPELKVIRGADYIPEEWLVTPPVIEGLIGYSDEWGGSVSIPLTIYNGLTGTEDNPILDLSTMLILSDDGMSGYTPKFALKDGDLTPYGLTLTEDGKVIGTAAVDAYTTISLTIEIYFDELPEDEPFIVSSYCTLSTTSIVDMMPSVTEFELTEDQSSFVTYEQVADERLNGLPYYTGDDGTYLIYNKNRFQIVASIDEDDLLEEEPLYSSATSPNTFVDMYYYKGASTSSSAGYMYDTAVYVNESTGVRYRPNGFGSAYFEDRIVNRGSRLDQGRRTICDSYIYGGSQCYGLAWTCNDTEADTPYTDGPTTLFGGIKPLRDYLIVYPDADNNYAYGFHKSTRTYNNQPVFCCIRNNKAMCIYATADDVWCIAEGSIYPDKCSKLVATAYAEPGFRMTHPAQAIRWDVTSANGNTQKHALVFAAYDPANPDNRMPTGTHVTHGVGEDTSDKEQTLTVVYEAKRSNVYKLLTDYQKYGVDKYYWIYCATGSDSTVLGRYIMCDTEGRWFTAVPTDAGWECEENPLNCKVATDAFSSFDSSYRPTAVTRELSTTFNDASIKRIKKGYDVTFSIYEDYSDAIHQAMSVVADTTVTIRVDELVTDKKAEYYLDGELLDSSRAKDVTIGLPASGEGEVIKIGSAEGDGCSGKQKFVFYVEIGTILLVYTPPPAGTTSLVAVKRKTVEETAQDVCDRMNDANSTWAPYTVYDGEVYTRAQAERIIKEYKGGCSYANYHMKNGPYSTNYYAYAYCYNGSRSVNYSYYYDKVPAPSLSTILSRQCVYENEPTNNTSCFLGSTSYYDSPSDALEALGEGSTCSCGSTASTYLDDTPSDLQ